MKYKRHRRAGAAATATAGAGDGNAALEQPTNALFWGPLRAFMRSKFYPCLLAATIAFTALLAAGSAAAANIEVHAKNAVFTPAAVTAQAGDTVTFYNDDTFDHDVMFDGGFGTGVAGLKAGQNWSHTFAANGSFPFHCSLHTGMAGTVTVGAAAPAPGRTPGFELAGAIVAVSAVALLARRRFDA